MLYSEESDAAARNSQHRLLVIIWLYRTYELLPRNKETMSSYAKSYLSGRKVCNILQTRRPRIISSDLNNQSCVKETLLYSRWWIVTRLATFIRLPAIPASTTTHPFLPHMSLTTPIFSLKATVRSCHGVLMVGNIIPAYFDAHQYHFLSDSRKLPFTISFGEYSSRWPVYRLRRASITICWKKYCEWLSKASQNSCDAKDGYNFQKPGKSQRFSAAMHVHYSMGEVYSVRAFLCQSWPKDVVAKFRRHNLLDIFRSTQLTMIRVSRLERRESTQLDLANRILSYVTTALRNRSKNMRHETFLLAAIDKLSIQRQQISIHCERHAPLTITDSHWCPTIGSSAALSQPRLSTILLTSMPAIAIPCLCPSLILEGFNKTIHLRETKFTCEFTRRDRSKELICDLLRCTSWMTERMRPFSDCSQHWRYYGAPCLSAFSSIFKRYSYQEID